jgi:hypothetical protein
MRTRVAGFHQRARTSFANRTIRRNFVQILILLLQIHEIGNVQKSVPLQPYVYESRLHAWQHARYPALINRPG